MNLRCGDCATILQEVDSDSVDLTVTSPPYDNLRTYHGYSFDFPRIAAELYRVTKPGGVVVWVVGDQTTNGSESGTSFRQALHLKDIGFKLYDTMIFAKLNPVPRNHRRYQDSFEFMFVLSKGMPKTFNALLDASYTKKTRNKGMYSRDGQIRPGWNSSGRSTKTRSNIWSYGLGLERTGHPAVFPLALAEDHIRSWTNPGDMVLDPFMGSGTTGVAARRWGRRFLGIEISPEFFSMASDRLTSQPVSVFYRELNV